MHLAKDTVRARIGSIVATNMAALQVGGGGTALVGTQDIEIGYLEVDNAYGAAVTLGLTAGVDKNWHCGTVKITNTRLDTGNPDPGASAGLLLFGVPANEVRIDRLVSSGNTYGIYNINTEGVSIGEADLSGNDSGEILNYGTVSTVRDGTGPGDPDSARAGSPGSRWRRTDSGGDESTYTKRTGHGTSGWSADTNAGTGSALELDGTTGYVRCADATNLDIVGDLDVRWGGRATDYTPGTYRDLVNKLDAAGSQKSWWLEIAPAGTLQSQTSVDGANFLTTVTSTVATGLTDNTDAGIRMTVDVDDGGGNRVVSYYTKTLTFANSAADLESDAGWTLLGTAITTAGTTTIFAGTADLLIGAYDSGNPIDFFAGLVYGVVIKNGIAGTTVANPDFTKQTVGATAIVDDYGNVFTLVGGAALVAA